MHACNLVLAAALLTACAPVLTEDQIARETARNVIRPILADRFPGVPLEPYVDCAIDNATAPELYDLARTRLTGLSPEALATITSIATRPGTLDCLGRAGTAALPGQGAF